MIIEAGNVFTKVVEATKQEKIRLYRLLCELEEEGQALCEDGVFPTGLIPFLRECKFDIHGLSLRFPDLPTIDDNILETRTLRDYQSRAVIKSIINRRGIVQAATGAGKTEICAATVAHLLRDKLIKNVLILVPSGYLMEQTYLRFRAFGFHSVCCMGYGHKYKPNKIVYVSVVDSAYRLLMSESSPIAKVDALMLDEAHHAPAKMWSYVCSEVDAKYRLAYTATAFDDPEKYCFDDLLLIGLTGPIIFDIPSVELRRRGYLAEPVVTLIKTLSKGIYSFYWQAVYDSGIKFNYQRNSAIASVANSCYEGGYKTLIFVGYKKHGHIIARLLQEHYGVESIFVQGGKTTTQYSPSGKIQNHSWSVDDIGQYVNNRERVIVITTTVLDEGIDIPIINVLIMGTGMKKYRRTIQRLGRGMRPKEEGEENKVYVFDFWDDHHQWLESQSEKRLKTYEREEYTISGSVAITEEMMGMPVIIDRKLRLPQDEMKKIRKKPKPKADPGEGK